MVSRVKLSGFLLMLMMFLRPLWGERLGSNTRAETEDTRDLVVLLHGICKSKLDMMPMHHALRKQGYDVINWDYPSRKHTIEELADQLNETMQEYADRRVHYVTHSMGGIIVRTYLNKYKPTNCGRFVMIAPPNKGALLADFFGNWLIYKAVFGPAGQELRQGAEGVCEKAGVPECEFAIIAGGKNAQRGMNPLIPGDNDGTISVECTKLDGTRDFMILPYAHPYIQYMPRTIVNTIHFLQAGHFAENPIHNTKSDPAKDTAYESAKPNKPSLSKPALKKQVTRASR